MFAPSRAQPSSPCTKVCVLDAVTGLCEGCGRTRDEIALWGSMSETQRLAIMVGLGERLSTLLSARKEGAQP